MAELETVTVTGRREPEARAVPLPFGFTADQEIDAFLGTIQGDLIRQLDAERRQAFVAPVPIPEVTVTAPRPVRAPPIRLPGGPALVAAGALVTGILSLGGALSQRATQAALRRIAPPPKPPRGAVAAPAASEPRPDFPWLNLGIRDYLRLFGEELGRRLLRRLPGELARSLYDPRQLQQLPEVTVTATRPVTGGLTVRDPFFEPVGLPSRLPSVVPRPIPFADPLTLPFPDPIPLPQPQPQPLPLSNPLASPVADPQPLRPLDPLRTPTPTPVAFPLPFATPAPARPVQPSLPQPFRTPLSLPTPTITPTSFAMPQPLGAPPGSRADPCKCVKSKDPDKKRKKPKPREVCRQGTYTQRSKGIIYTPRRIVPCR